MWFKKKEDPIETPEVDETPMETPDEAEALEKTPEEVEGETPEVDETLAANGEYTVVTPVKRGGKRYAPGEKIRFGNGTDEAKILLEGGAIR